MKSVIFRSEFRLEITDSFCFFYSLPLREFISELAFDVILLKGWFYLLLTVLLWGKRSISLWGRAFRGRLVMKAAVFMFLMIWLFSLRAFSLLKDYLLVTQLIRSEAYSLLL
jgi:hypothetical protein